MQTLLPGAWTADVDYLRLTHKAGEGEEGAWRAYKDAAELIGGGLILDTYRFTPWQFKGYSGWTLGGVSYGHGVQGAILQVSGGAAGEAARLKLPCTGVPRIDLQATYWLGADFPSLAWQLAEQTDKARFSLGSRMWKARMVDGRGDGDTLYIGRRGGESKFLRVYDKWRQQGYAEEWRYAWRFEAELTDGHAAYAYGTLMDVGYSHYSVLAQLDAYFTERGIKLPEVVGGQYFTPSRIKKPPEDILRTVRWLEEQVRPALDKAMGKGLTADQIAVILGLTGDAQPDDTYRQE